MRQTRNGDTRPLIDELYALVERALSRITAIPAVPPFPVGFGVPLASLTPQIDPVAGVDASTSDGSPAKPFKTTAYFYSRLLYLYGNTPLGPNLSTATTPTGVAQPHLALGSALMTVTFLNNVPVTDPVGILANVTGPAGAAMVVFAPAATVADSGTLTVTQTFNRTNVPALLWQLNSAGKTWTPGRIIRDTVNNTITWIQADLGGGSVQTSQWFTPMNASSIAVTTNPVITAPGNNAYQTLQLATANLGVGKMQPIQSGLLAGATQPFAVTFTRFNFNDAGVLGSRGATDGFAQLNFVECNFATAFEPAQSCNLLNCFMAGDISSFDNDHRMCGGIVQVGFHVDGTCNMICDGDVLLDGAPPIVATMEGIIFGTVGKNRSGSTNMFIQGNANLAVSPEFYGTGLFYESSHSFVGITVGTNGNLGVSTSLTANLNVVGSFASADIGIGQNVYPIATITGQGCDSARDQQVGGFAGLVQPTLVYPRQVSVGGGFIASGGTPQLAIYTTTPAAGMTGNPNGNFTAVKGSLFIRTDVGAAAGSRVYVNQDGATTWAAIAGV